MYSWWSRSHLDISIVTHDMQCKLRNIANNSHLAKIVLNDAIEQCTKTAFLCIIFFIINWSQDPERLTMLNQLTSSLTSSYSSKFRNVHSGMAFCLITFSVISNTSICMQEFSSISGVNFNLNQDLQWWMALVFMWTHFFSPAKILAESINTPESRLSTAGHINRVGCLKAR